MAVLRFIVKRLGYTVFVLIGISFVVFALMHIAPGSPAALLLGDTATPEQIRALEEQMGLDQPLIVQYFIYMSGVVRGDLGTSLFFRMPNSTLIFQRMPNTAYLAMMAVLVTLIVSLPLGLAAGVRHGSLFDFFTMGFVILGQSISNVVLGLVFILFFAVNLNWLPAMGFGYGAHVILPAITMASTFAALFTSMLRSGMVDVLQEDYITATYAKGIDRRTVIWKYALRNASLPTLTMLGLQIGTFLAGSVLIEQIFNWPGIGSLTIQAIGLRDFSLVQSIILVVSGLFVLVNVITDILYTLIDPRMTLN